MEIEKMEIEKIVKEVYKFSKEIETFSNTYKKIMKNMLVIQILL